MAKEKYNILHNNHEVLKSLEEIEKFTNEIRTHVKRQGSGYWLGDSVPKCQRLISDLLEHLTNIARVVNKANIEHLKTIKTNIKG
jgi:hypothetical protein